MIPDCHCVQVGTTGVHALGASCIRPSVQPGTCHLASQGTGPFAANPGFLGLWWICHGAVMTPVLAGQRPWQPL